MSGTIRALWEEVYRRFDPEEPTLRRDWRAERPYSPREDILAGLDRPFGEPRRYLLFGTRGTGKSTELFAIAEEQISRRMVVLLDVNRHFTETVRDPAALQHVQPWEVLLLAGMAVYKAAAEAFGQDWIDRHVDTMIQAITAFADGGQKQGERPEVDLAKLAGTLAVMAGGAVGGVAGAALKLLKPLTASARWSFPLGRVPRKNRRTDQDPLVLELLTSVNALIGTVQQNHRELVIVVDGLDRISNSDTTENLFVESVLLSSLKCRTIVAGPVLLRSASLAARVRGFQPKILANAPVLDQVDPLQEGPGIEFLLELYQRRVQDLEATGIHAAHLRKLAYYSGGRGRDFVRLIRMAAEKAWDRELDASDENLIDHCIDERRRTVELGLDRGRIDVLRSVVNDLDHRLPDDSRAAELLDQQLLLPYPNESEWYFPHPLLTLKMVPIRAG
ncbi:MAG: hypothetical protein MJE77_21715 [Proteobacteria bacterium]|nr:hypothetical protein [Pseudomonadota bacterium]